MNAVTGLLVGFLVSGSYLLFWPVYRLFHPRRTQRRQALLRLFLLELGIYAVFTALVIVGAYTVGDFHHLFLFVYVIYSLLTLFLWVATYGVWADNPPEPDA